MKGEDIRRSYVIADIDDARDKIVKGHKKCKGTGVVPENAVLGDSDFISGAVSLCSCHKKFGLASRFILSQIPYKLLKNQQIYARKVEDQTSKEEINLNKEVIYPCINKIKTFIKNPYGLMFLGKNGTGKTFIGLKILYYAIKEEFTAHSIEFPDLLKLFMKDFGEDHSGILREILNVDILMLDEIGSESKREDFSIGKLKASIKNRINLGKPTILISNYSYKAFCQTYGKSVESVVGAYFKILDFSGVVSVRKTKVSKDKDNFFEKMKKK